jgi:hypothetical protein
VRSSPSSNPAGPNCASQPGVSTRWRWPVRVQVARIVGSQSRCFVLGPDVRSGGQRGDAPADAGHDPVVVGVAVGDQAGPAPGRDGAVRRHSPLRQLIAGRPSRCQIRGIVHGPGLFSRSVMRCSRCSPWRIVRGGAGRAARPRPRW